MKIREKLNYLQTKLQGSIVVNHDRPLLCERINTHFEGIKNMPSGVGRNTRDDKVLFRDIVIGMIREEGIRERLEMQFNDQEFDHANRSSYAWDIGDENIKLEIKPHKDIWFVCNEDIARKLINNSPYYDFMVTANVKMTKDYSIVTPRWIIYSSSLNDGLQKSKFKSYQWYYDGPREEINGE